MMYDHKQPRSIHANHVAGFDQVMLEDVLTELKDFLQISWPELETAIKCNDIKRLLRQRAWLSSLYGSAGTGERKT